MPELTRRAFTAWAASAGLSAAALTQETAKGKTVPPSEKVSVALIGCGGMGRGLLQTLLRCPDVNVRAVCDVDPNHIRYAHDEFKARDLKNPDAHKDFREVLDRKDVDAVVVATLDHWHALPTIMACQAGKDVYVEKPLARTIGEGRAMVKAARKYERVVQAGTQQRSAPHFQEVCARAYAGQIGKIRRVKAWAYLDWVGAVKPKPDGPVPEGVDYDMWLGPAPERPFNPNRFHFNFRWFWDYSGGLMTDWGTHMIDMVNLGTGMNYRGPRAAYSAGGKFGFPDDAQETPDTQLAVVEYDDFVVTWEHASGLGVGPWRREHGVEFHGSDGILVVDRQGWELLAETVLLGKPRREYRMMPIPWQGASRDHYYLHVRNFIDCVRTREKPAADVSICHNSSKICHLANIAYRLKRRIEWDDKKERVVGDPEAQAMIHPTYRPPWKLPEI